MSIPVQQRSSGPPRLVIIGTTMLDTARAHSTVLACPVCEAATAHPCINPRLASHDQVLHYAVHEERPTVAVAVRDDVRGVDTVERLDDPARTRAVMHRNLHESHTCVRPGCDTTATVTTIAAGVGRLAGRDWRPGDLVDFCPDDMAAILDAQTAVHRDDLPEWLAVDAKPTDADLFGELLNAPTVEAAQALAAELRRRGVTGAELVA